MAPWKATFGRIYISYISIRKDDRLVLCYARATMCGPTTRFPLSPFRHESANLICGNLQVPYTADWLEKFKRDLEGGSILIDENLHSFVLAQGQVPNYHVTESAHHGFDRFDRAVSVQISGGNHIVHGDVDGESLSWEVRSSVPPYDNVGELLDLLHVRRDVFSISSPYVDIEALPPGVISADSQMKDGKTTIVITGSILANPELFTITYKTVFKDKIERSSGPVAGIRWRESDGVRLGDVTVESGGGARMHVFLQYDDYNIHHRWLRDPHKYANPLLAIYETFDTDSEFLEKILSKPKANSASFEAGVAMLLATLGLPASHYGASKLHDEAPDIVAPVPGLDVVLAIECTTDVLDKKDKLSKLISRSRALQDSLNASNYEHIKVVPLIVSALPLAQLQPHMNTARDNGVAVASLETLRAWQDRRLQPLDQRALFDEIVGLIPKRYDGILEQMDDDISFT
jgi:hypothetical protein